MLSSFLVFTLGDFTSPSALEYAKSQTQCNVVNIKNETKNIANISLLYQYTNTPPLASGSPASKTAESILRSKEYNSLPNNGRSPNKNKDRQYWTPKDGDFPMDFSQPTSNIDPHFVKECARDFVAQYAQEIDDCAKKTLRRIRSDNADVLTKGRQTWDVFSSKSITAPDAFKQMLEFFQVNLGETNFTMLGWIKAWSSCFKKEIIKVKLRKEVETITKVYDRKMKMFREQKNKKIHTEWVEKTGQEKDLFLFDIATEFCSYLKTKERSKLKRRAICSANMILRMYFDIIENFHLELSKVIKGSTIALGGIEKQKAIEIGLNTMDPGEYNILATEDATKWNECLSAAGFFLMHHVFFNKDERNNQEMPSDLSDEDSALIEEIFNTGIFLLSKKRVFLGYGNIVELGENFARFDWRTVPMEMLNANTKEWFEKIKPDLDERNCVYSPFGMLMGMLNAGSTTYGLLATVSMSKDVATVRSSDDSIQKIGGENIEAAWQTTAETYVRQRRHGINPSMKKNRYFRWAFGEYTSWYIDGTFTSQYGVEISSIRPKGDTCHTDFHSCAAETNVSLREFRLNNMGAEMMLGLRIANTRRLWRVKRNPLKRLNVGVKKSLLLADGGNNPWHGTTTCLSEYSLKKNGASPAELDYLYKVFNPENPFSHREEERLTYSHTVGSVISDACAVPRNIFCQVKRPNKTVRSTFKRKEKVEMEVSSYLVKLLEILNPSSAIACPQKQLKFSDFLRNSILQNVKIVENDAIVESDQELLEEIKQFVHDNFPDTEDSSVSVGNND
uniref:RNA-directed RNA polymerase catalytic subunit n=1 Tax=Bemisia tabaci Quaranja-like virus 1 TaxID=2840014 RepID=A0A8E8FUG8_9ORTO|nr:PB1 [Bemisia tabaci Quaranja-like virus 1]